jgi:4a-hydroxytetrahydrobiopterin dehydratase
MSAVLSPQEIQVALLELQGWKDRGDSIVRVFQFPDFLRAMIFVNKIAEAAEAANHHPDILINYDKVTLTLASHDSGGVTRRDIRMAGKANEIANEGGASVGHGSGGSTTF